MSLADIAAKRIAEGTMKANTGALESAPMVANDGETLLFLLPEEITIPAEVMLDVRPFTSKIGGGEREAEAIANLAASIDVEGQILPVRVRYGKDGQTVLVDGRRRTQAVSLINAGKAAGETALRVKCVITKDDLASSKPKLALGKAHRQSMMANLHANRLSPMDMAMDIGNIRKQYSWTGAQGTNNVADYLKVSPATVIQYEKVLTLAADIQEQIHVGVLSMDAAFALVKVPEDKRPAVLEKAKELEKAEVAKDKQQKAEVVADTAPDTPAKTKRAPRTTGTVKSRHVKEAARQVSGDAAKPQSRGKKEIMEFMDSLEGPISGYPNGLPHRFLREFHAYCSGSSSDRQLQKVWLELIERAPKGNSAANTGTKPDDKKDSKKSPK